MELLWTGPAGIDRIAEVAMTERVDGDLSISTVDPDELEPRREGLTAGPWSWLRQIHSDRVVDVRFPGEHRGTFADAAFTRCDDAVLVAHAADCVPVALISADDASEDAMVGAAHAGWRGLEAGVLESLARAMRSAGAGAIKAIVGPHICERCYEFGTADLDRLARRFGSAIVGETATGAPALDLAAAVQAECERIDVAACVVSGRCTACEPERFWSHRARAETGRQAMTVVIRRRA